MKIGKLTMCKKCDVKRVTGTIKAELRQLLRTARKNSRSRNMKMAENRAKRHKKTNDVEQCDEDEKQEATEGKGKEKEDKDDDDEVKTKPMEFDIDLDFLVDLLQHQEFRCEYSGVPFLYPCIAGVSVEPLWRMSLERLNVLIGYTKANVCLICRGFQSLDNTRKRKVAIKGSSGWSKAKVDHVMRCLELRSKKH